MCRQAPYHLMGRPAEKRVAMTGELTLRGKVLPIWWAEREAIAQVASRVLHQAEAVEGRPRI